ncbi:MAG: glycosyltransferase family 4 protein [Bacteroidales bacterium]|nr:glycosyltransferase family 4 protein [Bacteroidales bacterium]
MRIGFDAKKAMRNRTGIGNYSRRCIQAVKEEGADIRLFYNGIPVWGELWRNAFQWLSIRKAHIDVYHGLSNELPFGIGWSGAKSVVTIHDLIFLRFPQTYGWLQRQILKLKTRYACSRADKIIAVSEMTKRDIIHFYGTNSSRIEVIYQSIDDVYRRPCTDEQLRSAVERYQLPQKFVLCVGTIQARKNQHTLVKALPHLSADVHLILVGKEEAYAQQVRQTAEQLGVAERVHIYKGVPTADLPAFYQLASVFACLSRFEGFGIPLAEAIASGTPVIGATGSCLEEAAGPDSVYLDPDDSEGLAKAIAEILADPQQAQRMSERGKEYSLRFTDESLGQSLTALYKQLLA